MKDLSEIRQKYGSEMGLVIAICRVQLQTATVTEVSAYISSTNIDWLLFEKIITAHHIRPLAFKILADISPVIDVAFLERLRSVCLKLSAANLLQLGELKKINNVFNEGHIRYLPYKGIILSQALFNDFAARETVDIDILLEPVSFTTARECLLKMGYTSQYYNPAFGKQFLRTSHELQFSKDTPAGTLKVELHWAITSRMMAIQLNDKQLFEHIQQSDLSGLVINVPDPTLTLLILLVHHGVNDVWRSVKHTVDVAAFLDRYAEAINWDSFHLLAIRSKIRHTTEVGFAIAHELFGAEIPKAFEMKHPLPTNVIDDMLRFPAITKGKLQKENFTRQLFLRDTLSDKLKLLFSYVRVATVPNIRDIERNPLPKGLYFVYYLIKPFRMLSRRGNQINSKK